MLPKIAAKYILDISILPQLNFSQLVPHVVSANRWFSVGAAGGAPATDLLPAVGLHAGHDELLLIVRQAAGDQLDLQRRGADVVRVAVALHVTVEHGAVVAHLALDVHRVADLEQVATILAASARVRYQRLGVTE